MNITYRQLSGVKLVRASKDLSRMANCHLLVAKKHRIKLIMWLARS